jgi:long-chain acyl-CoA synthetase
MNFIENILHRLNQSPDKVVLREVRDGVLFDARASELVTLIGTARAFLKNAGVKKGDRCAVLAHNSIRWVALDLALMAEGIIVVPLYARQAAAELVGMIKDSGAALILCGDTDLRDSINQAWAASPKAYVFDEVFNGPPISDKEATPLKGEEPVTIIYTSGTSGEPKGVILNVRNLDYMLGCTNDRLDLLMGPRQQPDEVFHYLPLCFAGSWIMLLSCLSRNGVLTLSTDLNKLADELKIASPNYFLNVPALLERVRSGIEDQLKKKGGFVLSLYQKAKDAWMRQQANNSESLDGLWLGLAKLILFPTIKKKLGPNLVALICGSAPLARDTQLFFMMIGIPVLQVYGLTETTAICTMDDPRHVVAGRVGPAIDGIEMKLGDGNELLVRGPNVFPGYWNRTAETAKVLREGWFHTGDQGATDEMGNWSIIGRVKNLLVLSSGHNIAPEPIEEMLVRSVDGAQQVVVFGHGRSFLSALITGNVKTDQVEAALKKINSELPHYKCIRAFHLDPQPLTIESGLLTANGKLKRDAIAAHFKDQIERFYQARNA